MVIHNTHGQSKHWMEAFLASRGLDKPNGAPLYRYNVTVDEYRSLTDLLANSPSEANHPISYRFWSACFCLFVAEKYRREYDASEGGWSWQGFDRAIGERLSPQVHQNLVLKGLDFWIRPIRQRASGTDYLGSLFAEGGLPWRLLQTENHGFGRAVSAGLRRYYRNRDLISVVREYERYFPVTFQNTQTLQLLASIVEYLIRLAEEHDIENKADPATFLDENAPGWRLRFPLPIGEDNARILLNEWLIDAGKSRKERRRVEEQSREFSCLHRRKGELLDWRLETEVFFPRQIIIPIQGIELRSTRLELAFFEGNHRLENAGVAYGRIGDDNTNLTVEFSKSAQKLRRQCTELPLLLHFLSNGQKIHAHYFDGSDLDWETLPLIFDEQQDDPVLVGTASTSVASDFVFLRVPESAQIRLDEGISELGTDTKGGRWVKVTEDISFRCGEEQISIRLNDEQIGAKLSLKGVTSYYDCLPNVTYLGWPRLDVPECVSNPCDKTLTQWANGRQVLHGNMKNRVGAFKLSVQGSNGETIFRRKIGVLPESFSVSSVPASPTVPARLHIRSDRQLRYKIQNEEVLAAANEDQLVINLEVCRGKEPPEAVLMEVSDPDEDAPPVILRLPFPQIGYRLFDGEGTVITGVAVPLDALLGMRLVLTSSSRQSESFYLVIELEGANTHHLERYYRFNVSKHPESISLFAFYQDIEQMLAAVSDHDACIKLSVETDRPLGQVRITRYDSSIENLNGQGHFEVVMFSDSAIGDGAIPLGMRLSEPAEKPVQIEENYSQGVGMGMYRVPTTMLKGGPWLIYPAQESPIKFRPKLWATEDMVEFHTSDKQPESLHHAAKLYHPKLNPDVFNLVVDAMSKNMSHSGWRYLSELKNSYGYLPLSAFESWRALSKNPAALALSVFRLELDENFGKKLANDLSVIWEFITISTWLDAIQSYRGQLGELGIAEEDISRMVEQRENVLAWDIPVFRHLKSFLNEPKDSSLARVPIEILLTTWYQELRCRHADNDRWPEYLSGELTNWINHQDLPDNIKRLSDIRHANSVAYLPIFMAYVTAGNVPLSSLSRKQAEMKFGIRVLSDFDREAWYEPVYATVLSNLLLVH